MEKKFMKLSKALPLAVLLFPAGVMAGEAYPTIEVVRSVVGCMADLGGQNEQNLYTCTCRHDYVADRMSFEAFDNGTMQERYGEMPGEKGGVVRDNEHGKADLKALLKLKKEAAEHCPVVKNLSAPTRQDS
jgi:hypothetical protein